MSEDSWIREYLDAPINRHGTPHVNHPEDFSVAEQREFLELVDQDRYVSKEEQLALLVDILDRRKDACPQRQRSPGTGTPALRRRHEEVSAQLLRAVADGAPAHVIDDLRVRVRRLAQQINAVAVNPGHRPRHRGPMNQNPRPLGGRASMDTRFGDTLDPEEVDRVGGRRGRDLDGAMSRYNVFHAKEPIRVAELEHDLPRRWKVVGDALAVMYRTDKWKADGTDEDYKHLHDKGDDKPYPVGKGVRLYEPTSGAGTVLPRPEAITLLGYCLGAFVRLDKDGQEYETNPRGSYLFSAPDGHTLWIYSPEKQRDGSSGFLAAFNGGNLRVLRDGIDG